MNFKLREKAGLAFLPPIISFLFAVFLISGVICTYGYWFPTNMHNVHLPPILSILDSGLYGKDNFVQDMLRFNPRTYYHYLISVLAGSGIGIPFAYLIVFAATIASLIFGLQAIARLFCQSPVSVVLLSFWGLTVKSGQIATGFFGTTPIQSYFALGFVIWGIFFSFRRSWSLAYTFFGIACLLNFLVGLMSALLISPLLILETWQNRRWFRAILALTLFAIGAGLVYIPMVVQGNTSTDLLTNQEFVEIYAFIRFPHHMVPSAWDKSQWIRLILFYTGGIICLQKTRSLSSTYRFGLLVVVGGMFLGLLVNFVFVEIWPLALVAKLQLARMTPFAQLAILIGLVVLFDEHFRQRNWAVCLPLAIIPLSDYPGLLLLVFALSLGTLEKLSPHLRSKSALWLAAFIVLCMYRLQLFHHPYVWVVIIKIPLLFGIMLVPHWLTQKIRTQGTRIAVAFSLAIFMAGTLFMGIKGLLPGSLNRIFSSRVSFYNLGNNDVSKLALRFREISPKDALIMIPPSVEQFRWLSQRSIVIDWKGFSFTDRGMLEWKKRLENVLGYPVNKQTSPLVGWEASDKLYNARSSSDLVKVAQRYKAEYILSKKNWHPDMPGEEIAREGDWVIWKVFSK